MARKGGKDTNIAGARPLVCLTDESHDGSYLLWLARGSDRPMRTEFRSLSVPDRLACRQCNKVVFRLQMSVVVDFANFTDCKQ